MENYDYKRIKINPSTLDDLDKIIDMERSDENIPYIRQWTYDRHRQAIGDDNIAHMIIRKKEDDTIIGYIILIGLKNPDRSLEFKRMVIQEKRRGYGRETFQAVKKIFFEDYNFHRIWLEIMEINKVGFELYRSEGFVVEGTHRDSLKHGKEYHSLIVMSMLEHEYV